MAQVIKLKRGNSTNLGTLILAAGEPAFTLDTKKLYIGDGTDKILVNPDQPNAETATKLQTARKISLVGAATGETMFDGAADASINLTLAPLTLAKISDAGSAASKNVGTASGQVPVLGAGGKLAADLLPAIAITDTFVVDNQAAMLALTAQTGDICVRTDLNKTLILTAEPASTVANWQELLTPPNAVLSVAGRTGAVTLTKTDVGLGNVTNESKTTMFASASLTGVPTAPTAALDANSTQIATTAFVKGQGYLKDGSVIDGGSF